MLTYLPEHTFKDSASVLSTPHLKESTLNAIKILILNKRNDNEKLVKNRLFLQTNPGARMWRNYNAALGLYGAACCSELERRKQNIGFMDKTFLKEFINTEVIIPPWYSSEGNEKERLISSHRRYLSRYDTMFYFDPSWYGPETSIYYPRYSAPIREGVIR